ncbi:hypothetical protein [Stutzerimonas stutzeri]|uniref:hypothetical protein n=1 Tax=Stutzerimonas stutzeri TaxID=316 RepID=UPI00210F1BEE|nr:hypothetical protein [Stutzerimonas stutzeri]MCQ4258410.1 hypothetical protein [Stutzerimonas stutzeri]
MKCSEQQMRKESAHGHRGPAMPDLYLPAMWPIELQEWALEWFKAWRKRCLYRRLLRLSDRQLRMRDLSRPRLMEKAGAPLRQLVAEQRSLSKQR